MCDLVGVVHPTSARLGFSLAAASLLVGGCYATGYKEVPEATARCQVSNPRTDAAHNDACHRCCRDQKTTKGMVWGYGTCKCFRSELYYRPPVFF